MSENYIQIGHNIFVDPTLTFHVLIVIVSAEIALSFWN